MEKPTTKVFGVCDFCGYDAETAVKYQMKQNGEELSEEEYEEEVAFYLFVSHADFCSEMADMVGEYDKDEENKTEHDQAKNRKGRGRGVQQDHPSDDGSSSET